MKRYDIAQAPQGGVMVEAEDGDYVRIEDVRELANAARLALECIERHVPSTTFAPREALRAALASQDHITAYYTDRAQGAYGRGTI